MSFQYGCLTLVAVAQEPTRVVAWKAFCGCCVAALVGRICRARSRRMSLAGDASSSGPALACGTKLGVGWWSSLIGGAMSSGSKDSLTGHSRRLKKGRSDRTHEAGQGHEAHAPG